MEHGNEIHCREREQSTKGHDLGCSFPPDGQHRNIGENANNPLVENGTPRFWVQIAEKSLGDYVIAAHAVKETRCADMASESARDAGNQEHNSISSEEQRSASDSSHVHEGGLRVRELGMVRPHQLC